MMADERSFCSVSHSRPPKTKVAVALGVAVPVAVADPVIVAVRVGVVVGVGNGVARLAVVVVV